MNYYTTFTTGTIDGLLLNTLNEDYCYPVAQSAIRKGAPYYYSAVKKTYVQRNNVLSDHAENQGAQSDRSNAFGRRETPVDTHLRTFLIKSTGEYRAILDDNFDFEEEFKSPFDDKVNKMLLVFKWIAGIQSITRNTVTITQADIDQLGLPIKLGTLSQTFEKLFDKEIVTSNQDNAEWRIRLGGGALKTGMGPGFVQMRIQIPALVEAISTYHKDLQLAQEAE